MTSPSDSELNAFVAEKVMGWRYRMSKAWEAWDEPPAERLVADTNDGVREFNPATDLNDTCLAEQRILESHPIDYILVLEDIASEGLPDFYGHVEFMQKILLLTPRERCLAMQKVMEHSISQ